MTRLADPGEALFARQLQLSVARHSLCWLAAANVVGVLLASLLLYPDWGTMLGELSYGRWMPLHLNWQLYGWCSLPLVGALLRWFLPSTEGALLQAQWALRLWSIALVVGGWNWLQGETTGKLFLDWSGGARLAFLAALVVLWMVLTWNFCLSARTRFRRSRFAMIIELLLLVFLAAVPPVLAWSSGRKVYPPIDPGTGGPTGVSLLGSTLMIVLVIGILPKALSINGKNPRLERIYWIGLALHVLLFLALRSAPPVHTGWLQIVGLGSLLIWIPGVSFYLRQFRWHAGSRPWLFALIGWWAALLASGFVTFLPGMLDTLKFTNALVAHAHVAMAGLLTSLNVLILINLARSETAANEVLGERGLILGWHVSLLLHLVALAGLASGEVHEPGTFFVSHELGWNLTRLAAGSAMALISICWAVRIARAPDIQWIPYR